MQIECLFQFPHILNHTILLLAWLQIVLHYSWWDNPEFLVDVVGEIQDKVLRLHLDHWVELFDESIVIWSELDEVHLVIEEEFLHLLWRAVFVITTLSQCLVGIACEAKWLPILHPLLNYVVYFLWSLFVVSPLLESLIPTIHPHCT